MNTKLSVFICYKKPNHVIDWLQQTLGFETRTRFDDENGIANHAELVNSEAVVVIQRDTENYDKQAVKGRSVGQGVYLCVHDKEAVDTIYRKVQEANAQILVEPETTQWGNYHVELLDPEGKQWSIGTYMPGEFSNSK